MDRLEAMSTFLAVVEDGSLSATARRLKTNPFQLKLMTSAI